MLNIFLFFLLCANVLKGDDNTDDGKFIDLLPEKDKEEFLHNIARRIVEEVQLKGHQLKSNEEVPESHLDMQSDFVSRLLKEEQANLQRRNNNETVKNNVRRDTRTSDNESAKVHTLEKDKLDGSGSEGRNRDNIDFTLRDGRLININQNEKGTETKTIVQDTTTVESENNKKDKDNLSIEITVKDNKLKTTAVKKQKSEIPIIPVQVLYDTNKQNELNILPAGVAAATTVKAESSEGNQGNVEETNKNIQKHDDYGFDNTRKTEVKEKENKNKLPTMHNLNETITEATINNVIKDNKIITSVISNKPSNDSKSKNILNEPKGSLKSLVVTDDLFTSTTITIKEERISYNRSKIDKVKTKGFSSNEKNKDSITLSPQGTFSNNSQVKIPNEEHHSYLSQDTEVKVSKNNHVNILATVSSSTVMVSTPTATELTEPNKVKLSTKTSNEKSETNTERDRTNKKKRILRSHENEESYIITTVIPINAPKTNKRFFRMSRMKKRNLINKPKPVLEQKVVIENNVKEFDSKTFYQLQKKYRKNKAYRVYEISPGKLPFIPKNPEPETNDWVRSNRRSKIEETPYYVPVHDYAPMNAYYNPINKLGPNIEDSDEDRDNIEARKKFLSGEIKAEETPYYVPVHNYAPDNAYYNPYNRLGPNNQGSENRQLLEDNGIGEREDNFNDADESGRKRSHHHKHSNNNQKHRPKPDKGLQGTLLDDFDMDYYFGRKGSVNAKSYNRKHKRRYSDEEVEYVEEVEYDKLRFPGSNEYNHPYNAIHRDQLKDHISSVRQVMFNNRLWGVIPDKTTTKKQTVRKAKNVRITKLRTGDDNEKILRTNYGNVVLVSPINSPHHEVEPDYHFGGIVDSTEYIAKDMTKKKKKLKQRNRKPKPRVSISCTSEERRNYIQCQTDSKENNKEYSKQTNGKVTKKKKITVDDFLLVANVSDARDVVELILKMQSIKRSKDNTLDAYLTVMEDMIRTEDKGLHNYDWLETAVDIQAALKRLLDLIKQLQDGGINLHPSDLQLLSYVVYLHDISEAYLLKNRLDNGLTNLGNNSDLPNKPTPNVDETEKSETYNFKLKDIINRARKANHIKRRNIDELIPLDQVEIPPLPAFDPIQKTLISKKEDSFEFKLKKLENFLYAVQFGVNDLHDAIKHVAMVSKYSQKLYRNLRDLYLRNPSQKQILELLLHLVSTRLITLVEESAVNGLDKKDYEEYIDESQDTVMKTREEFVFVLKLVQEIKNL